MQREEIIENADSQKESLSSLAPGQSTAPQAYMNFLKSILGISVIALPFATSLVGWVWSILLMIPIVFCSIKSNSLLIEIADDIQAEKLLYADAIRLTLGGFWPIVVDVVIVISQVGICIAYLIFFVESVISQFAQINIEIGKLTTYILSLLVILPLSFIKKIHFFHQTSRYGYYFALAGLSIMICDALYYMRTEGVHLENKVNIRNSFAFVGIAIAVCEGIVTILPIRDSMQNKLVLSLLTQEFMGVAVSAIMTAFTISLVVSLCAVFAFTDIKPIVMFNIANPYAQFVAVVLYAISLLLTYSLQLFPAVQIIEELVDNSYSRTNPEYEAIRKLKNDQLITTDKLEIFIRISISAAIYVIAYVVPHFSHFLNLIGSLFGSMIQFLFPVLAHLFHFRNQKNRQSFLLYTMILILAVLAMVLGSTESIHSMTKSQIAEI